MFSILRINHERCRSAHNLTRKKLTLSHQAWQWVVFKPGIFQFGDSSHCSDRGLNTTNWDRAATSFALGLWREKVVLPGSSNRW